MIYSVIPLYLQILSITTYYWTTDDNYAPTPYLSKSQVGDGIDLLFNTLSVDFARRKQSIQQNLLAKKSHKQIW